MRVTDEESDLTPNHELIRAAERWHRHRRVRPGVFITFEGPEGGGKTTQIGLLAEWLVDRGWTVRTTREPGGVDLAERIRAWVLYAEACPEAEALLFLAARAEHVRSVIVPSLCEGKIVICDRFTDSTLAYQGYGSGLDLNALRTMCAFAAYGLEPDLTLLLDLVPEAGLLRRRQQPVVIGHRASQLALEIDLPLATTAAEHVNKMDDRALTFHRRVREGFLEEMLKDPERIRKVNASRTIKQVRDEVLKQVKHYLRPVGRSYRNPTNRNTAANRKLKSTKSAA